MSKLKAVTPNNKPKSEFIKVIVGSLLSQATTWLIIYVLYKLIYQTEQSSYWPGFGAGIVVAFAFLPVMLLSSIFVLKLLRLTRWLSVGLVSGIAAILSYWLLQQSYADSRYKWLMVLPVVIALLSCLFTWYLTTKVYDRLASPRAFLLVFLVILGVVISITLPLNNQLLAYQQRKDTKTTQQAISGGLQNINFRIFMPKWLPAGLTIKTIQTPNSSSDDISHAPTRLELDTGPGGSQGLVFNEFIPSKEYSPPSDCGPYAAGTVSVGPAGYTITCQKVGQYNGQAVYFSNQGASNYPPEYDYYLVLDGTEITIADTISSNPLSQSDLQELVSSFSRTTTEQLPTAILEQQY
jgi:hypothetical protein